MEPFTQQELASMYEAGTAFNEDVENYRRKGGDPSAVWNGIYDEADIVFAVWRRRTGGYSATLIKGVTRCERIVETGQGEMARIASHVVPGPDAAVGMCRVFNENPGARWVYSTLTNGQRVLGLS